MEIDVTITSADDPFEFSVTVKEAESETRHRVTMSESTYHKLTEGAASPARCLHAAFEFLLDREPKESVLRSFDISVIAQYFPEFEKEIARYL